MASFQAKFYWSLFIARNTTILSSSSIDLILYPWTLLPPIVDYPTAYYGLAALVMFEVPPTSPPVVADPPMGIFYSGGSVCQFTTVLIWNGTTDFFTGDDVTEFFNKRLSASSFFAD